jgi:hypothetical protein
MPEPEDLAGVFMEISGPLLFALQTCPFEIIRVGDFLPALRLFKVAA